MTELLNVNTCIEYLAIPIVTVINVSVAVPGDPCEFFIDMVRNHFPEFQVQYGFGIKTDIKIIAHLNISMKLMLSKEVIIQLKTNPRQGDRIKLKKFLILQSTVLNARTTSPKS